MWPFCINRRIMEIKTIFKKIRVIITMGIEYRGMDRVKCNDINSDRKYYFDNIADMADTKKYVI